MKHQDEIEHLLSKFINKTDKDDGDYWFYKSAFEIANKLTYPMSVDYALAFGELIRVDTDIFFRDGRYIGIDGLCGSYREVAEILSILFKDVDDRQNYWVNFVGSLTTKTQEDAYFDLLHQLENIDSIEFVRSPYEKDEIRSENTYNYLKSITQETCAEKSKILGICILVLILLENQKYTEDVKKLIETMSERYKHEICNRLISEGLMKNDFTWIL